METSPRSLRFRDRGPVPWQPFGPIFRTGRQSVAGRRRTFLHSDIRARSPVPNESSSPRAPGPGQGSRYRKHEPCLKKTRRFAGRTASPTSGVGRQFSRVDIADRAEGVAAKVAVIRRSCRFERDGNLRTERAWQFVTSRRTGGSLPRPSPWRSRKSAGMCRVAAGPPAGTEGRCPGLPSPGTALQGS